jgi:hypothetical protein
MNFLQFKQAIAKQFARMAQGELFSTNISSDDLWSTYLNAFPEGTNPIYRKRTEHDCSCCRQFIKRIGGLVAFIDGQRTTIWDNLGEIDDGYKEVAAVMSAMVHSHNIINVFRTTERVAGVDKTFEQMMDQVHTWNHFHVQIPTKFIMGATSIGHALSAFRADYDVFNRSLREIVMESVDTVLDLIAQNSLYRGQEHIETLNAFKHALNAFDGTDNWVWQNLSKYHGSVLRIRNTSIGTLLIDLNTMDLDEAVKRFEAMVAPANYKRPTALVTPKMIQSAKETIEELGLTSALERRFANVQDITINNLLFADRTTRKALNNNVFDDLNGSVKQKELKNIEEVGIDHFIEKILPTAKSIEAFVENRHSGNFVSLIAPVDPTATPMFKWDNPFSWSYNGNVTDSIKERVKAAGGNINAEVCCRLAWEYRDDLDLHMIEPNKEHIWFSNRTSYVTRGQLDVDANGSNGMMNHPVENIFYQNISRMIDGEYRLFVNNWNKRDGSAAGFEVEIEVLGETIHLVYDKVIRDNQNVDVATLTVKNGVVTVKPALPSTTLSKSQWGVTTQTYVPVSAIMYSPNYWDGIGVGNKHFFFMLEGCVNDDTARGFYNEFLRSDLDKHRKVLEMVGSRMQVAETKDQLSGLGFSVTQKNSLILRVKGNFNRTIKVNF